MTKNLPETEEGYRSFFLMVLGNKPNLVTHPGQHLVTVPYVLTPEWAISLLPEAHYTIVGSPFDEGPGMKRMYRLTTHAYEVFNNVQKKLLADLGEKREQHTGFTAYESDDVQAADRMPSHVADRLAELDAEIEKEEEERQKQLEQEAIEAGRTGSN